MTKTIIKYGLIAGAIVALPFIITTNFMTNADGQVNFTLGMLLGYAAMLLAFSLVFVAIRNYRNEHDGLVSFGKAFQIGSLIVLIASTIYVITWLIDYYYFIPDFAEKYAEHTLNELKVNGAGPEELASKSKEMAEFSEMYKNPFYNAMITYVEILPVGLVITAISALILKRK